MALIPKNQKEQQVSLTDIISSKTIDTPNKKITHLNDELFSIILPAIKKNIPTDMKYFLDQDEIGIQNFDLIISILNIYSFFTKQRIEENLLEDIKTSIMNTYGLSFFYGVNRGELIEKVCGRLGLVPLSFDISSDIHSKIIKLGIPYEITLGISKLAVDEAYYTGLLDDKKYNVETTKSFVGYKGFSVDMLDIINTYGKRLDKNFFKLNNTKELLSNFNISNKGYLLLPKELLTDRELNPIKMNYQMSPAAIGSMQRGMWDGLDPKGLVTKEFLAEYILKLKQKHKLK